MELQICNIYIMMIIIIIIITIIIMINIIISIIVIIITIIIIIIIVIIIIIYIYKAYVPYQNWDKKTVDMGLSEIQGNTVDTLMTLHHFPHKDCRLRVPAYSNNPPEAIESVKRNVMDVERQSPLVSVVTTETGIVTYNHGSLNVPIEHHPTIRYMVYNGYYKVMSNIPKMGHLMTHVQLPT